MTLDLEEHPYTWFDCNNCKFLNMTEEQQRETKDNGKPHVCLKYNKRVFHRTQHRDAYFLHPCQECISESEKAQ